MKESPLAFSILPALFVLDVFALISPKVEVLRYCLVNKSFIASVRCKCLVATRYVVVRRGFRRVCFRVRGRLINRSFLASARC